MRNNFLQKANLLRKWSLISTTMAGSGHPTSCLSAADLMTILFDKFYRYDLKNPHNLANDRLLFSKGHAAPLLYALYAAAGAFPFEKLKTLRKLDSTLEGHPMPEFIYTESATGSLGQGLSIAAGLAIAIQREKRLTKKPYVYVLLGDGELAEGEIWEAANFASYYKLNNLVAIADINRLGQSQETMFGHHVEKYKHRFSAFGWETCVINGHNFKEIEKAFLKAVRNKTNKPFVILAKTNKGKGISFLDNKDSWHGKPLSEDDLIKALEELGRIDDEIIFHLPIPSNPSMYKTTQKNKKLKIITDTAIGEQIAIRDVYGKTLLQLYEQRQNIVVLDADVKNSTYSQDFFKAYPDRFIECFIAEQNMVSVAVGLSRLGYVPFVSTFAAFFSRTVDQIRMARLSNANIHFVGSHAGVSIGEDGPTQMGLEDVAFFGVFPNCVILQPSDVISFAKLLGKIAEFKGISYLRTHRPKSSIIYTNDESFSIGGSKILRSTKKDDVLTIAASGITVHEALKAYEKLKKRGILVRIVDCYSVQPVDSNTLKRCSKETIKPIVVTVEDHFVHGGLGDFILTTFSQSNTKVVKMAVAKISHSGKPSQLLADAGIDAEHIFKKVISLI